MSGDTTFVPPKGESLQYLWTISFTSIHLSPLHIVFNVKFDVVKNKFVIKFTLVYSFNQPVLSFFLF